MSEAARRDRFRGCLLGLAAGDALGTTLEFKPPGSFEPIDDMVGGGPFCLRPGQWTDDTSMALCLATSLIECGGFDATDQMQRYVCWWHEGYLSSRDSCFDIGNTVSAALSRFVRHGDPYAGSTDPRSAGNGSLMRLAPVPMYYAGHAAEAVAMAADSSRTTHQAQEAVDACRYFYFAGLLIGALLAVNLGDDADTTGAIYGQIAGAHYGAKAIPAAWRHKLTMAAEITSLADHLHDQAALPPEWKGERR